MHTKNTLEQLPGNARELFCRFREIPKNLIAGKLKKYGK